ncbi:MAG: hypothetical protein ACRD8Z_19920 [Nitrososphaeraceae archaeon]|jgi:hypothetical protein
MRILVAMDFAKEHGTGKYHRTLLSEEMTDGKSGGIIDTLYVNAMSRNLLLLPTTSRCLD